jgi:hypothetical protein
MSNHICLCCLNYINVNELVIENSYEYYHSYCYEKLLEIKKRKHNKLKDDIIDITDSLEINYSEEPMNLKLKSDYIYDKPIGQFIDLTTNKKILEPNYNNKNNTVNNILTGPDYAIDIAGNFVKIDKSYLINKMKEQI